MQRIFDTIGGLWQLARLALLSGFRVRGDYWTWRLHTAFGRDLPARRLLIRSVLDYARWVHRMRRGM